MACNNARASQFIAKSIFHGVVEASPILVVENKWNYIISFPSRSDGAAVRKPRGIYKKLNFCVVLKAFISKFSELVIVIYKRNYDLLSQPITLSHFCSLK